MKFLEPRIPRGVIYHTVLESIQYLATSLLLPLNDRATIARFESRFAEYCGRRYCVAFPFARTAIYFTLKHLDLPKGSEVILPPITIKGIVDVVLDLGLVPVYVDVDPETLSFDMAALERTVGPDARAAILTPLFGLVPDMTALVDFFRTRGIYVIEDFSQCLNGEFGGRRVGTFGEIGVYSSSSIKTLDTLGGGLAVTDDATLYEALKSARDRLNPAARGFLAKKAWINLARNVATTRLVFSLFVFPLLQIVRRLNPGSTLKQTGTRATDRVAKLPSLWFSGYSSLQARIGLTHLDGVSATDRMRVDRAEFLRSNSGGLFPKTTDRSQNVYWQLVMQSSDAKRAQSILARFGVDTATTSLELVSALERYPNRATMPAAERVYYNGIFLPCFPGLSQDDLERIVAAVREVSAHNDH